MSHSIIAPSSAARRMQCPGSRELESKVPDVQSESALEGEQAHKLAHDILLMHVVNESEYSREMIDNVKLYTDYVMGLMKLNTVMDSYIEMQAHFPLIHEESFGTPDAVITLINGIINVIDFKYGHSPVSPYMNWQLLTYASRYFKSNATYNLTIVQPRDYVSKDRIKTWRISASELLGYIAELQKSEELSMKDNAPLRPSSMCMNCKAKAICPALQQESLKLAEVTFDQLDQETESASAELALLQDANRVIEARISGLETMLTERLSLGEHSGRYELQDSRGHHTWTLAADEVFTLGDMYGVNIRGEVKPLTPKQAKDKGLPKEIIDQYSKVTRGKKLARIK